MAILKLLSYFVIIYGIFIAFLFVFVNHLMSSKTVEVNEMTKNCVSLLFNYSSSISFNNYLQNQENLTKYGYSTESMNFVNKCM